MHLLPLHVLVNNNCLNCFIHFLLWLWSQHSQSHHGFIFTEVNNGCFYTIIHTMFNISRLTHNHKPTHTHICIHCSLLVNYNNICKLFTQWAPPSCRKGRGRGRGDRESNFWMITLTVPCPLHICILMQYAYDMQQVNLTVTIDLRILSNT